MYYFLSPEAEEYLRTIWEYLSHHNETAAEKLFSHFGYRFHQLTEYPKLGNPRNNWRQGLRGLTSEGYMIVYQVVSDEKLEIVRVLHGARDIDSIFSGKVDA